MTSLEMIQTLSNVCLINKIETVVIASLNGMTPMEAIFYLSSSTENWAWAFQDEKKNTICIYHVRKS